MIARSSARLGLDLAHFMGDSMKLILMIVPAIPLAAALMPASSRGAEPPQPASRPTTSAQPRIRTRWVNPPGEPYWIGNNELAPFGDAPGQRKMPLRVQHKVIDSKLMKRKMGYTIYLPPGYEKGAARYPVLYFLHGSGGNEWMYWDNLERRQAPKIGGLMQWNEVRKVEASSFFTDLIEAGKTPPLIVVCPNGGRGSGYADSPDRGIMVESYFIKEFIPHIDRTYRTIAAGEGRAIEGFSMGAGGTLKFAFKYPEMFSSAIIYAGGIRGRGGDQNEILRAAADKVREKVRIRVVAGEKDRVKDSASRLRTALNELKIPHEYEVLEGVPHQYFQYHRDAGEKGLLFHAKGLWPAYRKQALKARRVKDELLPPPRFDK